MKKTLLLLAFCASCVQAFTQALFIDQSNTIQEMAESFFSGSGTTILNATFNGQYGALAFFEGSQTNIGIPAGLLLTTGPVEIAVAPNDNNGAGSSGRVYTEKIINR